VTDLDLKSGDVPEQRRLADRAVLQRPGMIYVLVLAMVAVTLIARSLIGPTLGAQSL
jgi:hypothetical protein